MSDGIPKIPSRRNQDPAHVMNLPSLNMGYAPCSKKDITIVDLDIQVYGLDEIAGSTKPVVAIVSAEAEGCPSTLLPRLPGCCNSLTLRSECNWSWTEGSACRV